MSISSGAVRKAGPFLGAGAIVVCPFAFKVFSAADLVVTKADSLGVETVYALTTNYTVVLNADQDANPGGSVTTVAVLASGSQIVITSNLAQTQPTVLANQGGFYPTVINDALDRLTILVQQLSEKVSRALVTPVSGTVSPALPAPAANYVIGWNGLGTALVNLVNATGTAISSAMQAFVTSATKAAARVELGVSGQFQDVTRIPSLTGTNALVGTLALSPGAYAAGLRVTGTPDAANSVVAPTLNLNSLGAVTIKKRDAGGVKVALALSDYNNSGPFTFEHDGTDFILLDPLPAAPSAPPDIPTYRNRLVNGNMLIDQEYSGGIPGVTNGSYACDQWISYKTTAAAAVTVQQVSAGLSGFEKALSYAVTVGAAPGVADGNQIQQSIEGYCVQDLQWGTANAKTVTLSFWAKQPVAGMYGGSLRNSAVDRSYVFTYAIATANTWQYFTITIPGDTSGTWLKDNGVGITVTFDQGSGTNRETAAGAWTAGNYQRSSACLTPITAVGTSVFTGMQLEAGTTASSYANMSYGEQLRQCQRYFLTVPSGAILCYAYSTIIGTPGMGQFCYPVTMRSYASPVAPGFARINAGVPAVYLQTVDSIAYATTSTAIGAFVFYSNTVLNINARL